ncbi:DUF4389 domain-containing protein [Candidatus Poriferisodalis sp.]|uniref:DUF4389 domain-containing protein n=1 Tax=Candidatus Poriferisodalis sp. TaxID=3101277 RepID=UPI003B51E624
MAYPASVSVETPDRIANWRPLVHWLLLIPHLIIFEVLQNIAWLLNVVGWVAIVFTGKLPKGLADFQSMYLRYSIRLYAYFDFLHEQYPPFAFDMSAAEPGGTPVSADLEPQLTDRNRLTVAFRLILAIPAGIFVAVTGLITAVLVVLGFFAVLFTGRWPAGMRDWVVSWYGVSLRFNTYLHLLTDKYPPFNLNA